ncbi:uncharacterized protein LOC126576584 [Anopheles aquasalis]|uniref:uncharacterized protein LOC126576584 n=1 Tax=Anopheles aquasalis TaxID=42839 RepID=UPI00215B0F40|nr:uncharacterized protein LOC126576584 [Anopheles aquasalis]
MLWSANDELQQYHVYTCLGERNLELARLETTLLRERYSERYVRVVKKLVELNEILNRRLNIDADNIRNVIQQDAFLQIPCDVMKKIVVQLEETNFGKQNCLNLLLRKVVSLQENYRSLLMKIFTRKIELETNDPKNSKDYIPTKITALHITRHEQSLRSVQNLRNYFQRLKNRIFKDNLYNDQALASLRKALHEQLVLIRKTIVIGRPVISNVATLTKNLNKLTVAFATSRDTNVKMLTEYKSIMMKERSAIVNASMEEVNAKRWSTRYISITPSMETMKQLEDNLHEVIENLKQNCFTADEGYINFQISEKNRRTVLMEDEINEKDLSKRIFLEDIENAAFLTLGNKAVLSKILPSNTNHELEDETRRKNSLLNSLTSLKSWHMLLDDFFSGILKSVCNTHDYEERTVPTESREEIVLTTLCNLLSALK